MSEQSPNMAYRIVCAFGKMLDWIARSNLLFIIIVLFLASYSKLLAGIYALAVIIRDVVQNRKSGSTWKLWPLARVIILVIVAERLLNAWGSVARWEHSRGGAKFHFEDFSTSKEMQQYFEKHYPVGSSGYRAAYDIETAGGNPKYLDTTNSNCRLDHDSEEFKRLHSGVDFDYNEVYTCMYESSAIWDIGYGFLTNYDVEIYLNSEDKIIRISAGFFKGIK